MGEQGASDSASEKGEQGAPDRASEKGEQGAPDSASEAYLKRQVAELEEALQVSHEGN